MNEGRETEEGGREEEKPEDTDETPEIAGERGTEAEGPGREEKSESGRGNKREVGEREVTKTPKLPPSGTHNWSKPTVKKGEV